jgi:hypothetical protein
MVKLKRKLKEFIEYNPSFGRKKCIHNDDNGYKVVYNIHYAPFTINDAYDYETANRNEDQDYETESESESDNETEVQREPELVDSDSDSEMNIESDNEEIIANI